MREGITPALHFVGFTDTGQYWRAIQIFGRPDFIHRGWDIRARREIADVDTIVFARGTEQDVPRVQSFNDSEFF